MLYSSNLRDDLKITLIRALKQAKSSLVIQIYSLSDPDILHLLEKRQREGVQLSLFHDKKQPPPLPQGINSFPVDCSGLMHRKIVVMDETTAFLGTTNFTTPSLKIHDNLLIGIHHPPLAQFFAESIEKSGRFTVGELEIDTFLLPEGGGQALDAIAEEIERAQEKIELAMFTLTHPLLVEKLIEAKQRGVTVEVYIDRYSRKGASKKAVDKLVKEDIIVREGKGGQLLHHKWALIDRDTLIFGSANWTRSAFDKNQDFLCVFKGFSKKEKNKLQKLIREVKSSTKLLEERV